MELDRKTQLKADLKTEFNKDSYGGFGAAKNGAIARAAFKNPEVFARITGVPEFIIKGISIAIEAIDCPKKINPDKYDQFASNWLDEFHTSGWEWSWLSPTVHLLFHHGGDIMRALPVSPHLLTGHVQVHRFFSEDYFFSRLIDLVLLQVILFEINFVIFYTNLHELFCQFIS